HTSRKVISMMRIPVQPNKAIVGNNAFAHSSGTHQDAFLEHPGSYEIIPPQEVGAAEPDSILTARCGRHALKHHLERLGYQVDPDGFLKHRENYEIVRPEDVGLAEADIILTARSGRHALRHHLERLGYQVDKDNLAMVYEKFLLMADAKKDINDEDLHTLLK